MPSTPDILIFCLFASQVGMMILAAFYLRRRIMPGISYLLWGLLALSLPIIGPYLVIASQPGEPSRTPRG
jgi:hypothetical protein